MFTVCSTEALPLLEQQLVSVSVSEGGVYKRLTYGMIHRERDHRARLFKPIPAFLSSLLPLVTFPVTFSFSKQMCYNQPSPVRAFVACFACPFSLASMGTEVIHAQQDFWLCQSFLSVTVLKHVQQNVLSMQL